MPKPKPARERRIHQDIVVDAYIEEERACSWYIHLDEFARCCAATARCWTWRR